MHFEQSIHINATPERVWDVLIDVERWPEWTSSMKSVKRLDPGRPFDVGSKARVKQPRLPSLAWEVFELEPGKEFSWDARSPGVTTTARHVIVPGANGGVTVTLSIDQSGPLSWITGLIYGGLTQRFLETETQGLKRCSESSS
jgi:uncharacterized membrane protein